MILKQVLCVPEAFWIERELNQELNENFLIRVVANGRFFFDINQLPLLEVCLIFSSVHLHRL